MSCQGSGLTQAVNLSYSKVNYMPLKIGKIWLKTGAKATIQEEEN